MACSCNHTKTVHQGTYNDGHYKRCKCNSYKSAPVERVRNKELEASKRRHPSNGMRWW